MALCSLDGAGGAVVGKQWSPESLVVIWDEQTIVRILLWSDVQVCLDGYVPLAYLADRQMRSTYVVLDASLRLRQLVFFVLSFDGKGFIERSWNLPLQHMAEIAGPGPDLGYGPIQLACRSQCPISWHAAQMWDPLLFDGIDEFVLIQQAVRQQVMRLGWKAEAVPSLHDHDTHHPQEPDQAMLKKKVLETELQKRLQEEQHEHEQAQVIAEAQRSKLMAQVKVLQQQNEALREQCTVLQAQMASREDLEQSLSRQMQQIRLQQENMMRLQLDELQKGFTAQLEARQQAGLAQMETERARFREQETMLQERLQSLQYQLGQREDRLKDLEQRFQQVSNHSADQFLSQLRDLGMNFLVFHPGAGHISVPVDELPVYVRDPEAYAAQKCFVEVGRYRAWLKHYQDPRCQAVLADGQVCGMRIIRMDSPGRFAPGESDRCARHACDLGIDRVVQQTSEVTSSGNRS